MKRYPALVGVVTFVVGTVVAVLLFALLDISWVLLVGPVIGIGCAAYAAYRTAQHDVERSDDIGSLA
jgi:hypothetical protein